MPGENRTSGAGGRAPDLEADQGRSPSDLGGTGLMLHYFLRLYDRQCRGGKNFSSTLLGATAWAQEINLTKDRLVREKSPELMSVHGMNTHGKNSVMSDSNGRLGFGAYIAP